MGAWARGWSQWPASQSWPKLDLRGEVPLAQIGEDHDHLGDLDEGGCTCWREAISVHMMIWMQGGCT